VEVSVPVDIRPGHPVGASEPELAGASECSVAIVREQEVLAAPALGDVLISVVVVVDEDQGETGTGQRTVKRKGSVPVIAIELAAGNDVGDRAIEIAVSVEVSP